VAYDVTMGHSDAAIIRGLRRPRYEPQLTQALAALFTAEPAAASAFVRMLLGNPELPRPVDVSALPAELACTPEEKVVAGRVDLRFRADDWDVIVEVKIDAGYGLDQLDRYLGALGTSEKNAYIVAVTRTVQRYGEDSADPHWRGSIQWRRVLGALAALPIASDALAAQWAALLQVLEEEGSMGFTKPEPELFAIYARLRAATKHAEAFLEVLGDPLLAALRDALGGGEAGARFHGAPGRKPAISRSGEGSAEYRFVVPANGVTRVSAGIFGWQPPTRFSVAPAGARRLLASTAPEDVAVRERLMRSGFRPHEGTQRDLRAFIELDERLLLSDRLEDEVVEWAHGRFAAMVKARFFALRGDPADDVTPLADDVAA
jgi:hypothetical protein